MKTPILVLALASAALPSSSVRADPVDLPPSHTGYLLQVDHVAVATLSSLPQDQMTITSDKVTRIDANTVELVGAKIVITLPGHAPMTIAGDHLTMITQK